MLASGAAFANPTPWQMNMAPGVSSIANRIHGVHMMALWVCVGIGVIVFGAMAIAIFRFRRSKGAVASQWTHSLKLELMWTTIPVLILILMAWPATRLLVDMANVEESDMTVKITGYQWRWRYEIVDYYGENPGINFISSLDERSMRARRRNSGIDPREITVDGVNTYLLDVDKPLVLPVGVKVRFVITADDVIHSWWVPQLGWKQDAIPGMIHSNWTQVDKPGTYRGQCAELCGQDHGFMPIVVEAVPKAEFEQWLAEEQARAAPAVAAAAQ